jgi:ferric-dicitrate binding protein FerR (iron transport regulator)
MTDKQLLNLIESLVDGDTTPDDHRRLQEALKSNSSARAQLRERIDLESALRTWASEQPTAPVQPPGPRPAWKFRHAAWLSLALAILVLLLVVPQFWNRREVPQQGPLANQPPIEAGATSATHFVGVVRQQPGCVWDVEPVWRAGRFAAGRLALAAGIAELRFDSGTEVILEAPCELAVVSADVARLLHGKVSVNVSELSNGFTLETPEARIVDEGTAYAVALDDATAEVHVFDGSVIWIPQDDAAGAEASPDRIEAGHAKRYLRSQPGRSHGIPFGQRLFVRHLEATLKEDAGDSLLAYDGFENLAGQIRRDRSGFGWAGGWQSARPARGKLAAVIDAPDDVAFGLPRAGRRLLLLATGDDIRRVFEQPLAMQPGNTYYISALIERRSQDTGAGQSLQISLGPGIAGPGRGHRRQQMIAFGISSDGFPFIKSGNTIRETALGIGPDETCLCVVKLVVGEQGLDSFLRVYRMGESIDEFAPSTWTATSATGITGSSVDSIRLTAGDNAAWHVDELKVGATWQSVTALGNSDK